LASQVNLSLIGNDGPVTILCQVFQDGSALSLSGVTVTIYLKQSQTSPDVSITSTAFTTSNGLTITNSSLGELNWVIPAESVQQGESLWYHAVAENSSSEVFTWAYGTVSCQQV